MKRGIPFWQSVIKMDEYINLKPSRSSPIDWREQHIYSLKNAPKRDFSEELEMMMMRRPKDDDDDDDDEHLNIPLD